MTNDNNKEINTATPNPVNDLGGRIQQLRRQRGISQEELANAVNVSRQAVSKWESAQAQPELEKLLALSSYFQVSTDYLLKGTPAAPSEPKSAASLPIAVGLPQNRQIFVINATLFNYVGLLLGWALWDYYQTSLCTTVSIIMSIIGGAVLAVGLNSVQGDERQQLWHGFWRWNIWPIAQLVLALFYSVFSTDGRLLAPIISLYFLSWFGIGLFVFCWGAWLIISISVWHACRHR